MRIDVTQAHIEKARERNCFYCPVELAIKDAVGSDSRPHVGYGALLIGGERYKTPVKAREFMIDFDCKLTVQPFSFEVAI